MEPLPRPDPFSCVRATVEMVRHCMRSMGPRSSRHAVTEMAIANLTRKATEIAIRVDAAAALTLERRRILEQCNAQYQASISGGRLNPQGKAHLNMALGAYNTAHKNESMLRDTLTQYDRQINTLNEHLTAGVVAEELSMLSALSAVPSDDYRFDRALHGVAEIEASRDATDHRVDSVMMSAQSGQDDESLLFDVMAVLRGGGGHPTPAPMAMSMVSAPRYSEPSTVESNPYSQPASSYQPAPSQSYNMTELDELLNMRSPHPGSAAASVRTSYPDYV